MCETESGPHTTKAMKLPGVLADQEMSGLISRMPGGKSALVVGNPLSGLLLALPSLASEWKTKWVARSAKECSLGCHWKCLGHSFLIVKCGCWVRSGRSFPALEGAHLHALGGLPCTFCGRCCWAAQQRVSTVVNLEKRSGWKVQWADLTSHVISMGGKYFIHSAFILTVVEPTFTSKCWTLQVIFWLRI